MENDRSHQVVRTRIITRNGRGSAYYWLRDHHRHVRKVCLRTRYPWPEIVSKMAADGVVNLRGVPFSQENLRKTWPIVLRDLKAEADRRAEAAAERLRRSQPPPGRSVHVPPAPPRPPPPAQPQAVSPAPGSEPKKPYDPDTATREEMMAHAWEALKRQDSRSPSFDERVGPYVEPLPPKGNRFSSR